MPRPVTSTTTILPLLIATAACAVLAVMSGASAKQPKPGDRSLFYCARNNDGSIGDISYDEETRKCCYWEGDGKGGARRVCLTCDENWKNCKESIGARRPNLSTPSPNLEKAPPPDGSGLGTKLRCRKLSNEFKAEGGTE